MSICMEQRHNTNTFLHLPVNTTTHSPHLEPIPTQHPRKQKSRGAMHIIRVMLFMMRRRRSQKTRPVPVNDKSRSLWKKLVNSMRPLPLERNESSPPFLEPSLHSSPSNSDLSNDALFAPSESPTIDPEGSQHSRFAPSCCYASAIDLSEQDQSEETEEEIMGECKETYKDEEGDKMIDAKAEEFIANFYYQMRLQHLNSMDPHYNGKARGL